MAQAERKLIRYHWELDVYRLSFDAAMKIFEVTRQFPKDEILGKLVSMINNPAPWLLLGKREAEE